MDQLNACFLWILTTLLLTSELNSFNLEPRVPIVKQGTAGSYFGYSVAQHITEVGGNRRRHARMLVGAPKDKGSGNVYNCEITTNQTDCQALVIEEKVIDPEENRTDQWLGVTVRSQKVGGFAIACAHRHVKTLANARWGLGRCFTLTSSLDYDDTWTPCEGRSTSKAHEEFGYCQAGTSAQITEDNRILFGSPGPYTWRGTIFGNSVEQGINADRQWYLGPLDTLSPVDKYSYLGMSVTSGKFFGKYMSYVGGAPRSNGTGQVVFFKKIQATPTYEVELVLSGDTFASSFGYEILSIDVNNDTLVDLVVGAPFYYGKDAGGAIYVYLNDQHGISKNAEPLRLTGKPDSRFGFSLANLNDLNKDGFDDLAVGAPYEGNGVVYIYLGSEDGISKEPAQIIRAEDLPGLPIPTFGYALSGGMDLDGNDYPDLLVGAYEADRVVLLRARPIIDIETTVEGELSNIDPYTPGCPGNRSSTKVCFTIKTCLRLVRKSSSGILKIKYSLVAEAFGGRHFSRVILARAKGETNHLIDEIVELSPTSTSFECRDELVYVKQEPSPDIFTPIKFKLTYSLQQTAPVPERPGTRILTIDSYPILNQREATKIFQVTFAKDCGEDDICQSDLHTSAAIIAEKEGVYLGLSNEILLSVNVSNTEESAYDATTYITHSSSLNYVGFGFSPEIPDHEKISPCSPVNKTLTTCTLGNPFKQEERNLLLRFNPSAIKDKEKMITFQVKSNSTSDELHVEDDVVVSAKIIRKVELQIFGADTKEQVFYGGEIRGESAMKTEDQVGSPVGHKYHVINKGHWKVETITVEVDWPYEVENGKKHGKWLLYLIEEPRVEGYRGDCVIDRQRVNPLKLMKPLTQTNANTPSDAAEYRDSDAGNSTTGNRRKRDTRIEPERVNINGKDGKIVTLDCLRNTAKCFKFRCHIYDLRANQTAIIQIRARLWNSTFVEDYPDVDYVKIQSRARIQLDPEIELEQDTSDDQAIAATLAYPDIKIVPTIEDVPIWIIIVSVCAGVLLLIIIILLLWKFGFFRRKKHEAMMKGNLEKQPNDRNNVDH